MTSRSPSRNVEIFEQKLTMYECADFRTCASDERASAVRPFSFSVYFWNRFSEHADGERRGSACTGPRVP